MVDSDDDDVGQAAAELPAMSTLQQDATEAKLVVRERDVRRTQERVSCDPASADESDDVTSHEAKVAARRRHKKLYPLEDVSLFFAGV